MTERIIMDRARYVCKQSVGQLMSDVVCGGLLSEVFARSRSVARDWANMNRVATDSESSVQRRTRAGQPMERYGNVARVSGRVHRDERRYSSATLGVSRSVRCGVARRYIWQCSMHNTASTMALSPAFLGLLR